MSEFLNLKDLGQACEPNFALVANRLANHLRANLWLRTEDFAPTIRHARLFV